MLDVGQESSTKLFLVLRPPKRLWELTLQENILNLLAREHMIRVYLFAWETRKCFQLSQLRIMQLSLALEWVRGRIHDVVINNEKKGTKIQID